MLIINKFILLIFFFITIIKSSQRHKTNNEINYNDNEIKYNLNNNNNEIKYNLNNNDDEEHFIYNKKLQYIIVLIVIFFMIILILYKLENRKFINKETTKNKERLLRSIDSNKNESINSCSLSILNNKLREEQNDLNSKDIQYIININKKLERSINGSSKELFTEEFKNIQMNLLKDLFKESESFEDRITLLKVTTNLKNQELKELSLLQNIQKNEDDIKYKEDKIQNNQEILQTKNLEYSLKKIESDENRLKNIKLNLYIFWKYTFVAFMITFTVSSIRYISTFLLVNIIKNFIDGAFLNYINEYIDKQFGYFLSTLIITILPLILLMILMTLISYLNVGFVTIILVSSLIFLSFSNNTTLQITFFYLFKGFIIVFIIISLETYIYYKILKYNINEIFITIFILISLIIGWYSVNLIVIY
jgi:hypothetical protein